MLLSPVRFVLHDEETETRTSGDLFPRRFPVAVINCPFDVPPRWILIGLHALAFSVWACYFVRDILKPPMNPIQAEALRESKKSK